MRGTHCWQPTARLGYNRELLKDTGRLLGEAPLPEFGEEGRPGAWILSSDVVPSGTLCPPRGLLNSSQYVMDHILSLPLWSRVGFPVLLTQVFWRQRSLSDRRRSGVERFKDGFASSWSRKGMLSKRLGCPKGGAFDGVSTRVLTASARNARSPSERRIVQESAQLHPQRVPRFSSLDAPRPALVGTGSHLPDDPDIGIPQDSQERLRAGLRGHTRGS